MKVESVYHTLMHGFLIILSTNAAGRLSSGKTENDQIMEDDVDDSLYPSRQQKDSKGHKSQGKSKKSLHLNQKQEQTRGTSPC